MDLLRYLSLAILTIAFSTNSSAQSFTLWGTQHTYPGGPRVPCTTQHEAMTDLATDHPDQIDIPHFIYAEGEAPAAQVKPSKYIIGAGEDDNVHSYVSLFLATEMIVSQIYEAFAINQNNPESEYWNNIQTYWNIVAPIRTSKRPRLRS
jgi:hypothetical protein